MRVKGEGSSHKAHLHEAYSRQGVDVELGGCHVVHVVRHRKQRLRSTAADVSHCMAGTCDHDAHPSDASMMGTEPLVNEHFGSFAVACQQ